MFRRSRLCLMVIAAALAASWSLSAQAQWKWRDKGGQLHISDRAPPPEVPDKDVLQRPDQNKKFGQPVTPLAAASAASAPASAPGDKARVDKELEARRKHAEEQAAKPKPEDETAAAQRADNCTRAKNQLQALESGQRMARYNEKGEREVLDDKGRADEMQRARNIIASDCR